MCRVNGQAEISTPQLPHCSANLSQRQITRNPLGRPPHVDIKKSETVGQIPPAKN